MAQSAEQHAAALAAGRAVALIRWVLADADTPVGAYAKLRPLGGSVLLESVEGGERWGRYSILGLSSGRSAVADRQGRVTVDGDAVDGGGDPFAALRQIVTAVELDEPDDEALPSFLGGWVGYLGWGAVHWIEPTVPDRKPEPTPFHEAHFLEIDRAVLFDNVRHAVAVVVIVKPDAERAPADLLRAGQARGDEIVAALQEPVVLPPIALEGAGPEAGFEPLMSAADFRAGVERIVAEIQAGEAIQVVLSQRFQAKLSCDPLALYRAIRLINPSPYLFFMEFPEGTLVGSSPEVLVRTRDDVATLRPIAGTRKRGATPQRDRELEEELLNDPKEIAEHVMLVDLGRNDLGRISEPGTVQLTERMVIERYSHVMHIVSNIESRMQPGEDALSVLRACFPAGTVSGAPKVRAMQLIEEVEPARRGPYAGAVGYLDYRGHMDTGIAIRTFFAYDDVLLYQSGAGIVADSDPDLEYKETLNKARASFEALRLVERGLKLGAS